MTPRNWLLASVALTVCACALAGDSNDLMMACSGDGPHLMVTNVSAALKTSAKEVAGLGTNRSMPSWPQSASCEVVHGKTLCTFLSFGKAKRALGTVMDVPSGRTVLTRDLPAGSQSVLQYKGKTILVAGTNVYTLDHTLTPTKLVTMNNLSLSDPFAVSSKSEVLCGHGNSTYQCISLVDGSLVSSTPSKMIITSPRVGNETAYRWNGCADITSGAFAGRLACMPQTKNPDLGAADGVLYFFDPVSQKEEPYTGSIGWDVEWEADNTINFFLVDGRPTVAITAHNTVGPAPDIVILADLEDTSKVSYGSDNCAWATAVVTLPPKHSVQSATNNGSCLRKDKPCDDTAECCQGLYCTTMPPFGGVCAEQQDDSCLPKGKPCDDSSECCEGLYCTTMPPFGGVCKKDNA